MTTQAPAIDFDEAVQAEESSAPFFSSYPGVPQEVVRGFCGPWTNKATPREHQRAMLVFRLQNGFLNMAIEKTRELEETQRLRRQSPEMMQLQTRLGVIVRQKISLTNDLGTLQTQGAITSGEEITRLNELARLGTEENRLHDLITGHRDERMWVSPATFRIIHACLSSIDSYGGKPAFVRLPYSLETHAGYPVPDGDVHLVWVTETRGAGKVNYRVNNILWKEKLSDWVERSPKGWDAQPSIASLGVGSMQSPQESISFAAVPPPDAKPPRTSPTVQELLDEAATNGIAETEINATSSTTVLAPVKQVFRGASPENARAALVKARAARAAKRAAEKAAMPPEQPKAKKTMTEGQKRAYEAMEAGRRRSLADGKLYREQQRAKQETVKNDGAATVPATS